MRWCHGSSDSQGLASMGVNDGKTTGGGGVAAANAELLRDAVARNAGIVLSLPSAGILRHHKSRFLADAERGFWVESIPAERPLVQELITTQKPSGVSFKSGVHKVVFAVPVLAFEQTYRINADTVVEALLMAQPTQMKAIQRRNNYRVRVRPESELGLRVWRIAERAYLGDRPMAAQELMVELMDVSLGGVGIVFRPKDGEPPKVTEEDRLRVELTNNGETLLLEGRMRRPTPTPDNTTIKSGIQFKQLENDLAGRQLLATLTRIVGQLQREEVRRYRLGLTG